MWMPLGWVSASAPSAATSAFELISTTVLGSATPSVTFNITAGQQATYKHLQLRLATRNSLADQYAAILLRFNGDTGSNYANHALTAGGGGTISLTSYSAVSQTSINFDGYQGGGATSGNFGIGVIDILDAFATSKNKTVRNLSGRTGSDFRILLGSGLWMNTSAVSSISVIEQFGANFAVGSRFSLYGVRG